MGPLKGIRVIEMAGLAPVPYAGMILADFGADVVRVDRPAKGDPGPDPTRDHLARGKRSIAIDMKSPRGVELLMQLLTDADVLVEPFRPGVMERLGAGPSVALERNPGLIYARLTGWGQDGSYAAITDLVQDTDYTLGGVANTATVNVTRFDLSTKGLKRYLQVSVTPSAEATANASNNTVVVAARLGKGERGVDSAADANVTTLVVK